MASEQKSVDSNTLTQLLPALIKLKPEDVVTEIRRRVVEKERNVLLVAVLNASTAKKGDGIRGALRAIGV